MYQSVYHRIRTQMTWTDVKAVYHIYLKHKFLPSQGDETMNLVSFIMFCERHRLDKDKILDFINKHKCGQNLF